MLTACLYTMFLVASAGVRDNGRHANLSFRIKTRYMQHPSSPKWSVFLFNSGAHLSLNKNTFIKTTYMRRSAQKWADSAEGCRVWGVSRGRHWGWPADLSGSCSGTWTKPPASRRGTKPWFSGAIKGSITQSNRYRLGHSSLNKPTRLEFNFGLAPQHMTMISTMQC